jgi:cation-transporting ATPase E
MGENTRYNVRGLTEAEVRQRVEDGRVNAYVQKASRTYAEIIKSNVLTRFNAVLGGLFLVVIIVGSINDALFGMVLILNSLIGIIQEIRAKKTLDALSLISAPKTKVIREGRQIEISYDQVVVDDLIVLHPGDQIVVDGIVLSSEGLEIDESMLTGESLPVSKGTGEELFSGSHTVAGTGRYLAVKVGSEAYAQELADKARKFSLSKSELREGIDRLLKWIFWSIVPVAMLLFYSQVRAGLSIHDTFIGTVAGIVGIIPQGLVLLTSIAFAISVITLGRQRVLVQELPAVEVLARVDVLCVDKTGTLTDGTLQTCEIVEFEEGLDISSILGAICNASIHKNPTIAAIEVNYPDPHWTLTGSVPFSSERKWSYAGFGEHGHWILGAPEMLLDGKGTSGKISEIHEAYAKKGYRVLMLARSESAPNNGALPDSLVPVALILIAERVRKDVAEAMKFFREQGVAIKVISGDNPSTALSVARRAGIVNGGEAYDVRFLPDDDGEVAEIMEAYDVFGRVTPYQKQKMVKALQSKGHVVAMTGDGVNDVLALKDADLGMAVGSGVAATKSVARIVLLDGKFATLPRIVAEGRRLIANIELVANLFLVKTVCVMLIDLVTSVTGMPFPFLPRHLSLVSEITIGIPAFFLALAPNIRRYKPGFVERILHFVIPMGSIAAIFTMASFYLALNGGASLEESRTAATLTLLLSSMWVLIILARPITKLRVLLVSSMNILMVMVFFVPFMRNFFALDFPEFKILLITGILTVAAIVVIEAYWRFRIRSKVSESDKGSG